MKRKFGRRLPGDTDIDDGAIMKQAYDLIARGPGKVSFAAAMRKLDITDVTTINRLFRKNKYWAIRAKREADQRRADVHGVIR